MRTVFDCARKDAYFLRFGDDGEEIWNRSLQYQNGAWLTSEYLNGVVESNDGGFVAVGSTVNQSDGSSNSNIYVVKIDGSGEKVWEKTYKGHEATGILRSHPIVGRELVA